jgi:hypothetical protein
MLSGRVKYLYVVLIPLFLGLFYFASEKAISFLSNETRILNQKTFKYTGLFLFHQENILHDEVLADLSLPLTRKTTPGLDHDRFQFHISGVIEVPQSGDYVIGTESDDGSWIWIDGEKVLDNGGMHPKQIKKKLIPLHQGRHAIEIRFENLAGEAYLDFFLNKPDQGRTPLAIQTFPPEKMAFIARAVRILRWTSTLSGRLARFWLIFLGMICLYRWLFPVSEMKRGDRINEVATH